MLFSLKTKEETIRLIEGIADELELINKNTSQIKNNGLLQGKSGLILFFYYYAKLTNNPKYFNITTNLLDEVINNTRSVNLLSFYYGTAGFGWLIEHLKKEDFIEVDSDDFFKELDVFFYKKLMADLKIGFYDFLNGSTGYLLYFLNRTNAEKIIIESLDYLDSLKMWEVTEAQWAKFMSKDIKITYVDYGLAHGLAGMIVVLSKIYAINIEKEKTFKILNEYVGYVLSNSLNRKDHEFTFLNKKYINTNKKENNSGLGWTHGDLSVGISLYYAGMVTKNNLWQQEAIEVILHTCKRKNITKETYIYAGLGTGTSGIAHIYYKMYKHTGIERFKESAEYWYAETIELCKKRTPVMTDRSKTYNDSEIQQLYAETGILHGIAGVGLSLISTISDIVASWDECILLS